MKIALAYATPFEFAAMRGAIATVCLVAVVIALRRPLWPQMPGYTLVIGSFQVGGFGLFSMLALEFGTVGKSSILAYTFPLWVALLAWAILKERPHGLQVVAFPVAVVGFGFILYPFDLDRGLVGAACAVGAGISWAIGAVLMKFAGLRQRYDTVTMTAWQMVFGTLVFIAAAAFTPRPPVAWDAIFAFALFFCSVVSNGLGWFLWTYALSGLPAGAASFGILLSPIVGAVVAAVGLGERDPVPQLVGFAVLFFALVIFSLEGVRRRSGREAEADQASAWWRIRLS
jgi:drug/metabolite transporter (DMT)-like permease